MASTFGLGEEAAFFDISPRIRRFLPHSNDTYVIIFIDS